MATIIKSNLEKIGIKLNVKILEFNNLVARISSGKDYEAGIIGLTGGNEPNSSANVWKSSGRLHLFDIRKFGEADNTEVRAWEKEIDYLMNRGVRYMDKAKRQQYYNKMQEIIYEQKPLIYLVSPNALTAASNKMIGLRQTKYAGLIPHLDELAIRSFAP